MGTVPRVALLGAMKEEADGLRRRMSVERTIALGGGSLWEGRWVGGELLLLQTGPGRRLVEDALEFLLARYPVDCIVSFGFAGALADELAVGDLVLCSSFRRGDAPLGEGECRSDPWMLTLASRLMEAKGKKAVVGSGVTVDALVRTREERRALRLSHGADVVDMESYWAGMRAQARSIPFLAVRAVSDSSADVLPPLDQFFGSDGSWRWSRASAHFVAHPCDLARMPGVYLNSRRAASNLTDLLETLTPKLQEQAIAGDRSASLGEMR